MYQPDRHYDCFAPGFGILLIMVTLVVFLTELTSNIATTATLVPVLAASVGAFGLDTATVCILTALAASCAFMLPVATPPNAIVFGSGRIHAQDMARAGFVINLCGIATIGLIATQIIPLALGAR